MRRWAVNAAIVLVPLVVGGYFGLSSYREFEGRAKFAEVYGQGFQLQDVAAHEFSAPRGARIPGDREVTPVTRYVRRVVVSPVNRSIVLWVDPSTFDEAGVVDGALLRFTLVPGEDSWTCAAEGIPRRFLPVPCRRRD